MNIPASKRPWAILAFIRPNACAAFIRTFAFSSCNAWIKAEIASFAALISSGAPIILICPNAITAKLRTSQSWFCNSPINLSIFCFCGALSTSSASGAPILFNASVAIRRTYWSLSCNSCLKAGTASTAPSPIELNANTTLTRTNLSAPLSCNSCIRAGTASTAPSPIEFNAYAAFERTLESPSCNSPMSLSTCCSCVSSAYAIKPKRQTNNMQLTDFIIFMTFPKI